MTSLLRSEDGVRENMVIVVDVTSSSLTRRGSGGVGAENKTFATLVCMRVKDEKSSYEPSGPSTGLEVTPVSRD